MPPTIPPILRSRIVRFLLMHWRPEDIAREVNCHKRTVQKIQENMLLYGSLFIPHRRKMGRPRRTTLGQEQSLIRFIEQQPWASQPEMVRFLWEEWQLPVHQSTISRILKKHRISCKKGQRTKRPNEQLRLDWIAQLLGLTAEQLVFIDETLFNESTGWRQHAWAPIGEPARYNADISRGRSWSVLPAYTIDGYLPCTSIREGYFNTELIVEWLLQQLLPLCNAFPATRSVIIMDNASSHTNPRIAEVIRAHGCEIRYLPPYSPDFNPIELSFSVLKAWVRRHFDTLWPVWEGSFGDFLSYAVERSRCDRFAKEHFKHSAGGYLFEADIRQIEEDIENDRIRIDFDE